MNMEEMSESMKITNEQKKKIVEWLSRSLFSSPDYTLGIKNIQEILLEKIEPYKVEILELTFRDMNLVSSALEEACNRGVYEKLADGSYRLKNFKYKPKIPIEKEVEIIKGYFEGKSGSEIAKDLNMKRKLVSHRLKFYGLPPKFPKHKLTEELKKSIEDLYNKEFTDTEIKRKLETMGINISRSAIRNHRKSIGSRFSYRKPRHFDIVEAFESEDETLSLKEIQERLSKANNFKYKTEKLNAVIKELVKKKILITRVVGGKEKYILNWPKNIWSGEPIERNSEKEAKIEKLFYEGHDSKEIAKKLETDVEYVIEVIKMIDRSFTDSYPSIPILLREVFDHPNEKLTLADIQKRIKEKKSKYYEKRKIKEVIDTFGIYGKEGDKYFPRWLDLMNFPTKNNKRKKRR